MQVGESLHVAVDRAKGHDNSAVPEVNLAKRCGLLGLSPLEMMQNAHGQLDKHEENDDEAKDLVKRVKAAGLEVVMMSVKRREMEECPMCMLTRW